MWCHHKAASSRYRLKRAHEASARGHRGPRTGRIRLQNGSSVDRTPSFTPKRRLWYHSKSRPARGRETHRRLPACSQDEEASSRRVQLCNRPQAKTMTAHMAHWAHLLHCTIEALIEGVLRRCCDAALTMYCWCWGEWLQTHCACARAAQGER